MINRLSHLAVPLIAIILGLAAGAVIMLASGYNVVSGYSALWSGIFGEVYYIGESIRQITPYILSDWPWHSHFGPACLISGLKDSSLSAGPPRCGSALPLTPPLTSTFRFRYWRLRLRAAFGV